RTAPSRTGQCHGRPAAWPGAGSRGWPPRAGTYPSALMSLLADAQAYLAAAREPRATAPGDDLRRAYLDVLKLALCDLAGASTQSVGADEDGVVMSRELRDEGRRVRIAGMDWPLQGLTMVGM